MTENAEITLQALPGLRRVTRGVAEYLEPRLRGHLDFLAPLLRPKRLLGRLIEGPGAESPGGEEAAFAAVEAAYGEIYKPLRLHPSVPKPLPSIRPRLALHSWEEVWSAPEGGRRITVVSPLCWSLSYQGDCDPPRLREMLAGEHKRDDEEIRSFALANAILALVLERTPAFAELMTALRFRVEALPLPGCSAMRVPVIRSAVESVRPPGPVMLDAADLAGLSSFEEVIDPQAATRLRDPLRARLDELQAQSGSS